MNEGSAALTGLILLLTVLFSWLGFRRQDIKEKYVFDSSAVLGRRQYYRLVSAGFLHAHWPHLLLNMYGLWVFGGIIESGYGPAPFLAIYLISILGGNLISLLFHRGQRYRALGASGGVSGVIFATIFLFPGGRIMLLFPPVAIPAWLFALLFVLGSVYGIKARRDNIGHDAHLGGALVGLLLTAMIYPRILDESPALFIAVFGLGVAFMIFLLSGVALPRMNWRRPNLQWDRPRRGGAAPADRKPRREPRSPAPVEDIEPMLRKRRLNELLDRVSTVGVDGLSQDERQELEALSRKVTDDQNQGTRPH